MVLRAVLMMKRVLLIGGKFERKLDGAFWAATASGQGGASATVSAVGICIVAISVGVTRYIVARGRPPKRKTSCPVMYSIVLFLNQIMGSLGTYFAFPSCARRRRNF